MAEGAVAGDHGDVRVSAAGEVLPGPVGEVLATPTVVTALPQAARKAAV
ncbi:hypothetical protein OG948_34155 (plasmid) [Embleya sp. NBC_00888]|nr:hypothetical protein OG948_34155 [Embleya sp. NBC_00888]